MEMKSNLGNCSRKSAEELLESGMLISCKIQVDSTTGRCQVYFEQRGGGAWLLATARDPYDGKIFKTADAALGAAYRVGFKTVVVQMYE